MESDITPRTSGSLVSFEIPPTMTQNKNHIADKGTEDIENQ